MRQYIHSRKDRIKSLIERGYSDDYIRFVVKTNLKTVIEMRVLIKNKRE